MWRSAVAAAGGFQLPPRTTLPPPPSPSGLNSLPDHARGPRFFSQASSFSAPENDDLGKDPFPFSDNFDVADVDSEGLNGGGDGGEPQAPPLGGFEAVGVDPEQVESVLSVLQSSLERPLEPSLGDLGLALSEEFVVRVVGTPLVLGQNLIGFFRWAWKQPDFAVSGRAVGFRSRGWLPGSRHWRRLQEEGCLCVVGFDQGDWGEGRERGCNYPSSECFDLHVVEVEQGQGCFGGLQYV